MKNRIGNIGFLLLLIVAQSSSQSINERSAFPMDPSILKLKPEISRVNGPGNNILFQSNLSSEVSGATDRVVFAGKSELTDWSMEISQWVGEKRINDWTAMEIHRYPGGMFWAMTKMPPDRRYGFLRYRIKDAGLVSELNMAFFSIEFVAARDASEESSPNIEPSTPLLSDSIPAPNLVTRAEWGASPPNGIMVPHTPYRGAIHHTAENRITTLEQGKAEMKFMQDLHMNGNGWKDIGYHYCIDDSGRIYQGTEVQYLASHTDNNNTGNVGVSFMGNFSSVPPTQKALTACAVLMSYLETRYPIRTDSIFGHLDYVPSTACPGAATYALLPSLRNSIRQNASMGFPYVKNPQPLPFSTGALPSSLITFSLRDDQEGLRVDSLHLSVNGGSVVSSVLVIDSNEVKVTYTPPATFDFSSLVSIDVKAQDRAVPPHLFVYHYQFRIKAQTIYQEMMNENVFSNGTMTKTGVWTLSIDDAIMTDLTDGVMISTRDSTQEHSIVIHPNIKESGNYVLSLVLPRQELGLNARYVLKNSSGAKKEEFIEYNRSYEKAWFQLGTSPIYFTAGTPSNGSIEIQPMPNFTTMMMLDAIKLEKVDLSLPPELPELKSVRLTPQGKVEIQWFPSLEGGLAGYRIMKSADGLLWQDTIANEKTVKETDTLFVFSPPAGKGILYFRIVAVDTQLTINLDGNPDHVLSDPSDTYGVSYGTSNKILIVDNFDRIGSYPLKQHSFIRNFGDAIGTAWAGWEVAVNDAVETGEVKLEDYPIVIYMCGDDSDRDESVSNIELLCLQKYLQNGGYLFISGSEIGYDLGRAGRPDIPLYNAIFKSLFVGDDSGVRTCVGLAGSPLYGLSFDFGAVTSDTYIEEFPDFISPVNGSQAVLSYQNSGKAAAVAYTGLYSSSSTKAGRLMYFAFPFETIYPQQSRTDAMKKVLTYFDINVGVDMADENHVPLHYALQQNYPNPFNPVTVISYRLPVSTSATIIVYDILGREVATLVNEQKSAGVYTVPFDASNISSGIYFYRLTAGSFVEAKKMLVVK